MSLTSMIYDNAFSFFRRGKVVITCTLDHMANADRVKDEMRRAVTVQQMEELELLLDLPL